MFEGLWESFILLFVVFDAIGNVPIFYSLTMSMTAEERNKAFKVSTIVAGSLLVFFALLGWSLFSFYGTGFEDLEIAGGLLLLLLAIEGVLGRVEAETLRSEDVSIVPLATPLLAGPGSIYTVIYLSQIYGEIQTLISIIANTLLAFIILKFSDIMLRKLGRNLILVFSRIMSFVLAVIAVSMLREGVITVLRSL